MVVVQLQLQTWDTFSSRDTPRLLKSTKDAEEQSCNTSSHTTPLLLILWLLPGLVYVHWGFHFSVSMLLPREIQENQIWQ